MRHTRLSLWAIMNSTSRSKKSEKRSTLNFTGCCFVVDLFSVQGHETPSNVGHNAINLPAQCHSQIAMQLSPQGGVRFYTWLCVTPSLYVVSSQTEFVILGDKGRLSFSDVMFFVVHEVIRVWWQSWLRVSANAGFRPIIYLARDNSSLALCIEHHPGVRASWLFLIEACDWSADPECCFLIGPKLDKTGHSQGQQQLLFTRPHFGSHHQKITESHKNIYFNWKMLKSD